VVPRLWGTTGTKHIKEKLLDDDRSVYSVAVKFFDPTGGVIDVLGYSPEEAARAVHDMLVSDGAKGIEIMDVELLRNPEEQKQYLNSLN
jgi:hypothetical protein